MGSTDVWGSCGAAGLGWLRGAEVLVEVTGTGREAENWSS